MICGGKHYVIEHRGDNPVVCSCHQINHRIAIRCSGEVPIVPRFLFITHYSRPKPTPVTVPCNLNLIQPGGWVGLKAYRDAGHDGLGELAVVADLGFIVYK